MSTTKAAIKRQIAILLLFVSSVLTSGSLSNSLAVKELLEEGGILPNCSSWFVLNFSARYACEEAAINYVWWLKIYSFGSLLSGIVAGALNDKMSPRVAYSSGQLLYTVSLILLYTRRVNLTSIFLSAGLSSSFLLISSIRLAISAASEYNHTSLSLVSSAADFSSVTIPAIFFLFRKSLASEVSGEVRFHRCLELMIVFSALSMIFVMLAYRKNEEFSSGEIVLSESQEDKIPLFHVERESLMSPNPLQLPNQKNKISWRDQLKSPLFFVIAIMQSFYLFRTQFCLDALPYYLQSKGDNGAVGNSMSYIIFLSGIFSILSGWTCDKFGSYLMMFISHVSGILFTILTLSSSLEVQWIAMPFLLLSKGNSLSLTSSVVLDNFGEKNFGILTGVIRTTSALMQLFLGSNLHNREIEANANFVFSTTAFVVIGIFVCSAGFYYVATLVSFDEKFTAHKRFSTPRVFREIIIKKEYTDATETPNLCQV
eukprot:GHVP01058301.1.p1 GENE.GHVP01058301.1~~GHVP01058301.1.p1  ORF type:complete len:485 (-),score=60.13 GHVP01058301.1:1691-3145(-)